MAPPRWKRLIARLIVAVGTAETAHAHIVFTFPCFVAMAGEAWKRGGEARAHILSIGALAPAGLKCNHAPYSYCPPLPPLFSATSITQRDTHVTVVGLHNGGWRGDSGGWGCPNVAEGRKTVPPLRYVICWCNGLFQMPPYSHNNMSQKYHAACQRTLLRRT